MLRNTDLSQSYSVSMLPWIKDNDKRSKLISSAQKNSELYLQKHDNVDKVVTMESIFSKLTKGFKRG